MSEKSMIIPAIFDDCEAIQSVNGVPALVIQDKDGTNEFDNISASEFMRRTGVSLRLLQNLDMLLGMPVYWMNAGHETGDPEFDFKNRFFCNPTIFNIYQATANMIIAEGAEFIYGPSTGTYDSLVIFTYREPDESRPDGEVLLRYLRNE